MVEKKSFREKFQRKLPTLHFLLHFLHRDRAWVCAPKGTDYRLAHASCGMGWGLQWRKLKRTSSVLEELPVYWLNAQHGLVIPHQTWHVCITNL